MQLQEGTDGAVLTSTGASMAVPSMPTSPAAWPFLLGCSTKARGDTLRDRICALQGTARIHIGQLCGMPLASLQDNEPLGMPRLALRQGIIHHSTVTLPCQICMQADARCEVEQHLT